MQLSNFTFSKEILRYRRYEASIRLDITTNDKCVYIGDDMHDDCFMPTVCCWNPFYTYKMLSKMRAEMRYRGVPTNFALAAARTDAEVPVVVDHGDVSTFDENVETMISPVRRRQTPKSDSSLGRVPLDMPPRSSGYTMTETENINGLSLLTINLHNLERQQQEAVNASHLSPEDRRALMNVIKG